ncbi:synaptic vesicle glycoprotein 2B-like [Coccinella septempunctata]|uniref:synaptic vesicle glycoprotein 2B-like n=1 Tax=Coccinella septempunctata TaxID=41139 RepID=UPI001D08D6E7|nr:synaptic vesicle glycoprotein 2B-like [Coccinella septempunctata]
MAKISNVGKTKEKYSFDDALTLTGFGLYNVYLFLTIGGFLMCVIIETMSMMFIVPAAKCDLDLSLFQQGLLSSISFFGVVSFSYVWGFLADTTGRRGILKISLLTSFITSSICSIVETSWLFILLRFVNGMCIGGASSTVYAYLGEFHNDRLRPKIVSGVATFVAIGNMYLPGMAWLILPYDWKMDIEYLDLEFRPWRLLMIVYALPSFIFFLMLLVLPESPKFLMTQGKFDEVLEILKTMFSVNKGFDREDFMVSELIWDDMNEAQPKSFLKMIWRQSAPILRAPLRVKTFAVSLLQFGIFASTSGLNMWYPTILNTMSHFGEFQPNDDLTFCKSIRWEQSHKNSTSLVQGILKECNDNVKTEVFMVSLVIGMAYATMYIFIGLLINVIGKKNLLCIFITLGTISGILSQFVVGYQFIQILMGIFIIGGVEVAVVNAIVVDLFPTQVRAMALAMSLMFGRLGAMVGTNIVGPVIYNYCDYLFYMFAADHIVLLVTIFLLPSHLPLQKMVDNEI